MTEWTRGQVARMRYRAAFWIMIGCLGAGLPVAQAANRGAGESLVAHGAPGISACGSCHGMEGQGNYRLGYPRLAGLDPRYIVHELESFKHFERENAIMQPIAQKLTRVQMDNVAAWFASRKPLPPKDVHPSARTVALGEKIATRGIWSRNVPACFTCHGTRGAGVGPVFPRLAGQYPNYLETQLHDWRRGFRRNDPLGLMQAISSRLSRREISAVTEFLAVDRLHRPWPPLPERRVAQLRYTRKFLPPPESAMPQGPLGQMVRLGQQIFDHTPVKAPRYAGNALSCRNCHIDRGRRAGSAPMWAAYVAFPAYRTKNHKVNTIQQRIQGCFRFSENGHPPAEGSRTMIALVSYFSWLSQGAPTGAKMQGRGYPPLKAPAHPPNAVAGAKVFTAHCAICHGPDGQGTRNAAGTVIFPPLWGPQSYNWGAGMHQVKLAAAFIKANMPYGRGGTLTAQQAWDVAAFVDTHPRPPDPRKVAGLKPAHRRP
ncbi:MAG: c-type cytochrome [Acidiferrobacteraceae bacterium]